MSLPPNRNLLKEIKSTEVYVETGVYRGDSIDLAREAGYKKIIGIENDFDQIKFLESKYDLYRNTPELTILEGDSAKMLWLAIKEIQEPITFFLDSHWQMLEGTEKGKNPFPLLQELEQIDWHPIKRLHTILIDDWHIFYPDRVGYSKSQILGKLEQMGYRTIKHINNPVIDGMIMATK